MESKFIYFTLQHDTGKTKIYNVYSKEGDFMLGQIRWYGPWRCYALMPEKQTVFEKTCLKDILSFIEKLMLDRKIQKQQLET